MASKIARMATQADTWTVRRLLEWTVPFFERKDVDSPRLSAEMLLCYVLKAPRIKLYTDYDRALSAADLTAFRALVKRASEQEPIAYLTGRAPFFNLEFEVTPDVLIPRPDTETIVENVLQLARHETSLTTPHIVDLCTGSGCVAAAIAHHLKTSDVVAIDISPAAVAIAKKNIEALGLADRVKVEVGDLLEPVSRLADPRPFDLLTANPPYICTSQIETLDRSVKDYEPLIALDGGLDGLAFHRRILNESPARLMPGARVFLEIAFDQGPAALAMAAEHDAFEDVRILRDHAGHDRVLTGRRK
jgi:release factor glutamine methyltransferase